MRTGRVKRRCTAAALVAIVVVGATAMPATAARTQLSARMTGAANSPPGDPDGIGRVTFTADPATGRFCWRIKQTATSTPSVFWHIHEGGPGVNGPVVIDMPPPQAAVDQGCVTGQDPVVLQGIVDDPAGYYGNIHNADFPGGALRGQLRLG